MEAEPGTGHTTGLSDEAYGQGERKRGEKHGKGEN